MTPSSPKLEIPWPRFPVLDARLCQMKSFWWRLCSFFSFLVFLCACGHLSKLQFEYMNMPMDAGNNIAPAPSSCFAEVAESPAPETDCQNRLYWSIAGNGQHPYSWEIWLLIRKGRYRMATLAKAILQRPFQGIHHAIIMDGKIAKSMDFLFQANPWVHVCEAHTYIYIYK